MLAYITHKVQELLKADGATVLLVDEDRQEFYIPAASYLDDNAGTRMREIRFPVDKGWPVMFSKPAIPLIVHDTTTSPYFYEQVNMDADYEHKNMLDVPLRHQERVIGVCARSTSGEGVFDEADVGSVERRGQRGGPAP